MTYRCEDAPCCGCCGTSLYGSEVGGFSDFEEPDYYALNDVYREDDTCEDDTHDCHDCDGPSGQWVEGNFVPFEGAGWTCSWCDRPCPEGAHQD